MKTSKLRITDPLWGEPPVTGASPHKVPVTLKAFPWVSYHIRKLAGCACAGNAGNVFPATDFKGHARAVMHAGIANPRWREKRSRHSRRMRNPQFYLSDKRLMSWLYPGMFCSCWPVCLPVVVTLAVTLVSGVSSVEVSTFGNTGVRSKQKVIYVLWSESDLVNIRIFFNHLPLLCAVCYKNSATKWHGSDHEGVRLVTWFCYQMIAKPGNKTGPHSWPEPYYDGMNHLGGELL